MSDLPQRCEVRVAERFGWTIRVFQEGESYIAECISPEGNTHRGEESLRQGDAYSYGCNLVDREMASAAARKRSAAIKPFVLMLLYLTGWDEFYYDGKIRSRDSWIGYDFGILDELEQEKLLEKPQKGTRRRTYVSLNFEGIRTARKLLQSVNFPGVDELLDELKEHDRLSDEPEDQDYVDDASDEN
jgi:Domain of unknown function (DUF6429)